MRAVAQARGQVCMALAVQLVFSCLLVEGEGRRQKRSNLGKTLSDYEPKLRMLGIAIFAPLIVWFLYSLARDPALPAIMKRAGFAIRDRFAMQLGPAPKYKRR
ncbi:Hypothetical Protein FCC1311_038422 [Hondaea fermentalgiana]|uniref:Uncharacterized protein n=1 Tax=Hondaea fermentalgiana TaxID=2315210 RepID=A0A2R5GB91_9STRA|nr:Hypothetical Protein FCC1311_038422 [Hondaea fermentalgiana]|eukprot:GBG27619.1 Hypothetical Protein FCC1311_038422 [Hondaea fermentalgiana]